MALQALAWILSDTDRSRRLLAITGLEPGELRARATEPALLASMLHFLGAHEPDLVACAEALGVAPPRLMAAERALAG